jgi:hypothetical protein
MQRQTIKVLKRMAAPSRTSTFVRMEGTNKVEAHPQVQEDHPGEVEYWKSQYNACKVQFECFKHPDSHDHLKSLNSEELKNKKNSVRVSMWRWYKLLTVPGFLEEQRNQKKSLRLRKSRAGDVFELNSKITNLEAEKAELKATLNSLRELLNIRV